MEGWLGLQVALPHEVAPARRPLQTRGPPLSPLQDETVADVTQMCPLLMLFPHVLAQAALVMTVIVAACRVTGRLPEVPMLVLPHPVMVQLDPAKLLSEDVAMAM